MAVFQVYFTADFTKGGKGSREGYSIYYYARAGSRASGPYGKEPERWKFLPDGAENTSGRMEFFIGWHEKKSGNTPRGREKMFVRTENSCRKMRIFLPENSKRSAKMMKTGRKISFPAREKAWKLSRWQGKTCPKLGNGKRKKRIFLLKKFRRSIKIRGRNGKISQFPHEKNLKNIRIVRKDMPENRWQKQNKTDSSFKKVPRKQKNYGNRQKIFSAPHKKGRKNYSDEAKKSQKTDDPDEKKQQIFSQTDGKIQKCTGKEAEKFIESSEKSMKNIRPIGINSIIDGRSG